MNKIESQFIIRVSFLLFLSFSSYSQDVDLIFNVSATASSYDVTEGNIQTDVFIPFVVDNVGISTSNSTIVTMTLTHSNELTYNNTPSTVPLNWTCSSQTGGTVCSTSNGIDAINTSVDFNLAFNIGSTTTAGFYQIDGGFTIPSSSCCTSTGSTISTGINVLAFVTPPDFALTLVDIGGDTPQTSLDFEEGTFLGRIVHYQVVNNGGDAVSGATLSLTFDDLNFGLNPGTIPMGWNCTTPAMGQLDCTKTVPVLAGSTNDFFFGFGPISSLSPGSFPSLDARITDDSDTETMFLDNNTTTPVNVIAPVPVDLTFVGGLTETSFTLTSGDLSVQNITYQIINNGGNATSGVAVVLAFDEANFDITANSTTADWNCNNITVGSFVCNNFNNFSNGATADFQVQLTALPATLPGFYTPVVTADVFELISMKKKKPTKGLSPTATQIITDVTILDNLILDFNVNVIQNPDPVVGGETFNISVDVSNTGDINLLGVQIENTLPAGFSYAAIAKASSCTQNDLVMTCAVTNPIPPFATETVLIPVRAIDLVDVSSIYMNTTVVSGSNITTPISKVITLGVSQADFDVGISKSASVSSIAQNSPFNYTLSVSNLGMADVTGLTVVDNLPAGVQLVSINAPDWTCSGTSQISCMQNSLGMGASSAIILNVTSPSTQGLINNVAQVSIAEQDANTTNDMSQVSIEVMTGVIIEPGSADLQLTKTTSTPMLVSGEQYSWQIDILNLGPDTASNILINDLLPEGFEFDSVTTTSGTCQNTSVDITCQIPFIFNQDTVSIIVTGVATIDSGQLASTASIVSTDSTDPVPSNDSATIDVMVNPRETDLAVTIDSGEDINQGDSSDFIVNVVNNGPFAAHSPELLITVTGLLADVSINQGNDWNCQTDVFVISCQFNGEEIDNGQLSSVGLTVNTGQVVIDAEDLIVTAVVSTTNIDIDSNIENNTAVSLVGVTGTPTEGDIAGAIRDALGVGNPQQNDVIGAVAQLCETQYFTAFETLCESIYDTALEGDSSSLSSFLEEITPKEVIGQSTSLNEIALAQFRNIGARLNQLRGGGGSGFSSAGLNARYGSGSIPLGMLAYLNKTEEEAGKIDTNNDFISPWGFFVNGTISMGDRDSTGRELGFDFDTFGLTAGFDYRIDAKKVVGVAVGYANFDSKIEGLAELNSTGVTLTGYGSFYVNDNFYVDARISLAKPDFEQSRKIDFTLGSTRFDRTAIGDTTANQYTASMSAGYSFYKNAWNITPNASFTYTSTNVDGFTESGAGDFNIVYSEQDIESLVWSAGIRVSKAVSLKKGVITPQFDFDYNYQGLNDESLIEVRFIQASTDQSFFLETDTPDRSYGSAGLGLVYISANGKQAYFNYRSVLGLEGFSRGTFNIGARFEF